MTEKVLYRMVPYDGLLHIQLTIYFLIDRKRTVNFRNQRHRPHLVADYTIIMTRTLKVTGNHACMTAVHDFLGYALGTGHPES